MNAKAVEQTQIPGTEASPRKRQSQLDKAVAGDLVIAVDGDAVSAIEQVTADSTAPEIATRWKDQGIVGVGTSIEVWEARPGMYYRKRKGR